MPVFTTSISLQAPATLHPTLTYPHLVGCQGLIHELILFTLYRIPPPYNHYQSIDTLHSFLALIQTSNSNSNSISISFSTSFTFSLSVSHADITVCSLCASSVDHIATYLFLHQSKVTYCTILSPHLHSYVLVFFYCFLFFSIIIFSSFSFFFIFFPCNCGNVDLFPFPESSGTTRFFPLSVFT